MRPTLSERQQNARCGAAGPTDLVPDSFQHAKRPRLSASDGHAHGGRGVFSRLLESGPPHTVPSGQGGGPGPDGTVCGYSLPRRSDASDPIDVTWVWIFWS